MASEKRSQYEKLEGKITVLKNRLSDSSEGAARKFGMVKDQIVKIMS